MTEMYSRVTVAVGDAQRSRLMGNTTNTEVRYVLGLTSTVSLVRRYLLGEVPVLRHRVADLSRGQLAATTAKKPVAPGDNTDQARGTGDAGLRQPRQAREMTCGRSGSTWTTRETVTSLGGRCVRNAHFRALGA